MQVLDIFIGLVLIYFLYSLLTSIIVEMLSTWMGLRARHLRQGIENLLSDRPISPENIGINKQLFNVIKSRNFRSVWETDLFRWLKDILLVENDSFKYTAAGKFYQLPEIKSLAKRGDNFWFSLRNTKPSYISKETYTKALISMLSEKAQGTTLWEKVQFSVNNNALHLDQETAKRLNNLIIQSNGKYENFIELVEMEFDEMMDRLNGWYKRKIGLIIFWAGFIICVISNVDSISITKIIARNEAVRTELVALAEKKVNNEAYKKDSVQTKTELEDEYSKARIDIDNVSNILGLGWQFNDIQKNKKYCIDSISKVMVDSVIINKHKIDTLKNPWKYEIHTTNSIDSKNNNKTIGPSDSLKIKELEAINAGLLESIRYKVDSNFTRIDSIIEDYKIYYQKSPNAFEKGSQIIGKLWKNPISLLGILITALALSLGAQFWFDLLKKLVALRGAGKKPEEESNTKEKISKSIKLSNDGKYPLTSDPVELLISKERSKWEALPGFLGFNKSIENKEQIIEVLIDKAFNKPVNDWRGTIKVKFKHTNKGVLAYANKGDSFFPSTLRQNKTYEMGTASGIVINKRTGKKAILTCGHMVRTTGGFFEKDNTSVSIWMGNNWVEIGFVTNAVISCFADGGVIDIDYSNLDELQISNITEIREVNEYDLFKDDFKMCKISETVKIQLVDKKTYFTFSNIHFNDVRHFELLMFTNKNDPKTEDSKKGDSGALITDKNDIAIGILVGGNKDSNNNCYSYAIKITDLFEILQLETT